MAEFDDVTVSGQLTVGGVRVPARAGGGGIAGRFVPNVGVDVQVAAQSGQFVNPGVYLAPGVYTISMVPIAGVTSADQIIPTITCASGGPAFGSAQVAFVVDHAVISVNVYDTTSSGVVDPFYMHVDVI